MKDSLEKSIMLDPQKRKCYQQAGWISEGELTEQDIQMISRILTLESLGFSDTEIKDLLPLIAQHPAYFKQKLKEKRVLILEDIHQNQTKHDTIDYLLHLPIS